MYGSRPALTRRGQSTFLWASSNSSFITRTVWVLCIWSALGTERSHLCLPFICLSKGKTFFASNERNPAKPTGTRIFVTILKASFQMCFPFIKQKRRLLTSLSLYPIRWNPRQRPAEVTFGPFSSLPPCRKQGRRDAQCPQLNFHPANPSSVLSICIMVWRLYSLENTPQSKATETRQATELVSTANRWNTSA